MIFATSPSRQGPLIISRLSKILLLVVWACTPKGFTSQTKNNPFKGCDVTDVVKFIDDTSVPEFPNVAGRDFAVKRVPPKSDGLYSSEFKFQHYNGNITGIATHYVDLAFKGIDEIPASHVFLVDNIHATNKLPSSVKMGSNVIAIPPNSLVFETVINEPIERIMKTYLDQLNPGQPYSGTFTHTLTENDPLYTELLSESGSIGKSGSYYVDALNEYNPDTWKVRIVEVEINGSVDNNTVSIDNLTLRLEDANPDDGFGLLDGD